MTPNVQPLRSVAENHAMLAAPAQRASISADNTFDSVLQNQRQLATRGGQNRGNVSLSHHQGDVASSHTTPSRAERAKQSHEARRSAKPDSPAVESDHRSPSPTGESDGGRGVSNTTEVNDDVELDASSVSSEEGEVSFDADDASDINENDAQATQPQPGKAPDDQNILAADGELVARVVSSHDLISSEASPTDSRQHAKGVGASENGDVSKEDAPLPPHAAGKASPVTGPAASNAQFASSLHDSSAASASASGPATGPLQAAANLASQDNGGVNNVGPSPLAATAKPDGAPPAAQILPPDSSQLRDEANVGRIVRGLGTAIHQRGGSLTLRLDPPELGAVRIELNVRDGHVQARFVTQHESVRNLLMDQMGHLRQAFDRQGLTVERIEVQAMPQPHDGRSSSHDPDDGRGANHQGTRQHGESRGGKREGEANGRFESAFLESTKG